MTYYLQHAVASDKWDQRYFDLAAEVALWSKDPSSKIGCVYVGTNGQLLSTGYNGFPRGIDDTEHRLNTREVKYKYVVHAEKNGIYNACLNGTSLAGSRLYVYGLPICNECAKGIIQVGVTEVNIRITDIDSREDWKEAFLISFQMFIEAGIKVRIHNR
jgi:dCMP deaminase